ncbi:sulfur stress regulator [Raphidocelis subcapitata]|uniref:Sulfur stress regulator n=1 Tax=Raphidocelis subcapitata TaxID=307507 RepID=A0A2V0PDS2_9CHLO|nr:sulfur stress regulator [Raphidocelis subcapitata]|eukprot:GBF97986.1 sulfur stress regulator [Raphidocelis subcapitata]
MGPLAEACETASEPLGGQKKYAALQMIGRGSFGYVVLARDNTTGEAVAVKVIRRGDVTKYVEGEITNHSQLRHPHVIQFREVFLTPEDVCIVMEYATGGTLFAYLQRAGRLHEPVARWFFQQLVVGVDYVHRRGVVNRDIKLENTLLQVVPQLPLPLVKICDFGYSKADFGSAAKSKVGTLTYMAPEVLVNRDADATYDGKMADVWSCGVMLFVMVAGCFPFGSFNDRDGSVAPPTEVLRVLERMLRVDYALPPGVALSPECADLLRRMLVPDPSRRIRIGEILQHPWFLCNLPPHATAMNERYLAAPPPPGAQCLGMIRALISEAARSGAGERDAEAAAAAERAAAVRAAAEEEANGCSARAAARAAACGAGGGCGSQRGLPACPAPCSGGGGSGGWAGPSAQPQLLQMLPPPPPLS